MNRSNFKNIGEYFVHNFLQWDSNPFIEEEKSSKLLTYNDFLVQTQKTAFYLKGEGIKPGEKIIIGMENSSSALMIFFASLFSGIVPILIPWKNKTDELKHIIKVTEAVACFLPSEKQKEFRQISKIPGFDLSRIQNIINSMDIHVSDNPVDPLVSQRIDSTAYIVFTTGTTGTPKKVEISHMNMLEEIHSMAKAYNFDSQDRHLCLLPVHHASGLYRGILLPFHTGGVVILNEKFSVENFWEQIAIKKINFVQVVPSILKKLLMHEDFFDSWSNNSLKYIGSASAPHPVELIKSFENRFNVYILQGYGMTEATCGITLNPLDKKKRKLGSVGKPLSVNQIKILNDADELLLPGQPGRVFVYGDNIAIFKTNQSLPLRNINSCEKELDTGDIGYLDEDGFLWLTSRGSDLIKRGGYRMSSAEIEAAIMEANPEIEVAVLGVPHPLLGQDVIAFISKGKNNCNSRDIIRSIKGKISSYKIPSKIIFIDSFPFIGVGKIDKKKLQKLFIEENKK